MPANDLFPMVFVLSVIMHIAICFYNTLFFGHLEVVHAPGGPNCIQQCLQT